MLSYNAKWFIFLPDNSTVIGSCGCYAVSDPYFQSTCLSVCVSANLILNI